MFGNVRYDLCVASSQPPAHGIAADCHSVLSLRKDAERRVNTFTDIKQTTEGFGVFKLSSWISCASFVFLVAFFF